MPRTRRIIPDDLPLHIMVRGNNKQKIFQEDRDKKYYLYLLFKLKRYHGIDIYHYCLMDNHVHLVLLSRVPPLLSRFMMKVDLSYFFLFRNKYGYVGHLFQNRFKSNVIGHDEYLLQCGKYIELNPVRGGIVTKPEDYALFSYGLKTSLLSMASRMRLSTGFSPMPGPVGTLMTPPFSSIISGSIRSCFQQRLLAERSLGNWKFGSAAL